MFPLLANFSFSKNKNKYMYILMGSMNVTCSIVRQRYIPRSKPTCKCIGRDKESHVEN